MQKIKIIKISIFTAVVLGLGVLIGANKVSASITTDCSNVISLFHFDENTEDNSGKGNNGSCSGTTCPVLADGKFKKGLKFDGVDDFLNIGHSQLLNNSLAKFSVSLWVKADALTNSRSTLFSKYQGTWGNWNIHLSTARQFRAVLNHTQTAADSISDIDLTPVDQWTHYAATYDINDGIRKINLYIDAQEVHYSTKQASAGNPNFSGTEDMTIGGRWNTDNLKGTIDNVVIYNKALNPDEVTQIYESTTPVTCSSCGNGTCEVSEDCSSCPSDCTVPAGKVCCAGVIGDCCGNADCSSGKICGTSHSCVTCSIDQDGDKAFMDGGECGQLDCNDNNPAICPQAKEICSNGVDENCDGVDNACSEKLQVKENRIFRLTHPAYRTGRMPYSYANVNHINQDNSRIILDEVPTQSQIGYYTFNNLDFASDMNDSGAGRRMIWGCIADSCVDKVRGATTITKKLQDLDLDNASAQDTKLPAWYANTVKFPTVTSSFDAWWHWSPFPNENNILYTICEGSSCGANRYFLIKYNVDTQEIIPIIRYQSAPDINLSETKALGFSRLNSPSGTREFIIKDGADKFYRVLLDRQPDGTFGSNKEIIKHGAITDREDEWGWLPTSSHPGGVHGDHSPSGKYYGLLGINQWVFKNDFAGGSFPYNAANVWPNAIYWQDFSNIKATRLSWDVTDDWLVGDNVSCQSWPPGPYPPTYGSGSGSPSICPDQKVYQVLFDHELAEQNTDSHNVEGVFTGNLLVQRASSNTWHFCVPGTDCTNNVSPAEMYTVNYGQLAFPYITPDAKLMYFSGTNGKHTIDDKGACKFLLDNSEYRWMRPDAACDAIGNNYEGGGLYLAELEYADGHGDTGNPADINSDGNVNIKDIQICVKGIVASGSLPDPDYLPRCQAVAPPNNIANIKDIQGIIREIVNPS